MTRQELEHIIRAAADVTHQNELIIIGSQAILGQYPVAGPKGDYWCGRFGDFS